VPARVSEMKRDLLLKLARLGVVAVQDYRDWVAFGPFSGRNAPNAEKVRFGAKVRAADLSMGELEAARLELLAEDEP
jgi:hypothetical protein